MILLDTDILTHYMAGHPSVMKKAMAAPELPGIPIVVRIEALLGRFGAVLKAADSKQVLTAQARLAVLESRLQDVVVIQFDQAAAAEFDRLRHNKKLKKIGRNDLLIACIALANKATLVTRNTRDFQQVPGLRLENWAD